MSLLNVVDINDSRRYTHLKRHNAIEHGRANALDLLIKGKPLHEVLNQLVFSLEESTDGLRCLISLLDDSGTVLSPFVGPSLPPEFLKSQENNVVKPAVGTSAKSVQKKELIVCEDILQDPSWENHYEIIKSCGIRSCWSQPIIAPNGDVFGTFSMFFSVPSVPDQDDIESLTYEAQIISIILERANNIDQLKKANSQLEKRVKERTRALTETNILLKKALEQRNEVQLQLVELENMAALGTMMSSLTHEINTPIGVAITAISHLRALQEKTADLFREGKLKRSQLTQFYVESEESAEIIERNLVRSTQLIKTFKQLSLDQHSQVARKINVCSYLGEILLSLKPRLKRTQHKFCLDVDPDLEVFSNPGAISQLMINLIMNSAQHGFEKQEIGHILFKVRLLREVADQPMLQIVYKDNGCGMSEHTIENLYKPFFTNARQNGGSGLGMHICYNIVVKVLGGHIDCRSRIGKGVEFTITIPVGMDKNNHS
ncbi:GAF domain-containing sensor histidine kinase [Aliiglaciecola litoralis]|uniref:histidine kinase n=1 Tax=Aliiglaciecola litoralis TaxID=582857 RepID=A0ABN1LGI8_9ALTE